MKKIVAAILVTLITTTSYAGQRDHHRHHHGHRHVHRVHTIDWVAPLVIGSVVGYAIASRAEQSQPQIIVPVQPMPPAGFRYEQILDANCNCYRLVLVPN